HVQNKLTEMVLLTENMYSTGIAASLDAIKLCEDGCWWVNPMFANVTKQLVTKFPYEITKLSTDLAGGILGTAPSEFDLKNPKLRPYIEKYLQGIADYSVEDRLRMIRLLENIGFSVAFLIESVHGAGSPEAQRIVLNRIYDYEYAEKVAKYLAEINKKVEFKDEAEPWRETDTQKVAKH
ncbi:MAG: 4-hydroxyphenylacetate 3-hydroxylase C-terminal domain-containing protein, partial [Saccharolobus sp.]